MRDRYKEIGTISVVTEPKRYEKYGEVTGGFNEIELDWHVKEHGHIELLETLAYMQWQVWDKVREVNAAKNNEGVASN